MSLELPIVGHYLYIVDDNEVDRYLLKRILRSASVSLRTIEAEDGAQAMTFFEGRLTRATNTSAGPWPLVVFLDINMPKKNGLEFLRDFARFRQAHPVVDSSVVVMSTANRDQERDEALSYDFVEGYFEKGAIAVDRLASLLNGVMHRSSVE